MEKDTTRGIYKVSGGKILIFGDLHLSCSYEGQHKNYLLDCYTNMDRILEIVEEEKPKAVIFCGDLVGVKETNIKDRQFLMRVMMFFGQLNSITKGNVFSVKGNHDISDFSDFDFLLGMGYIKNPRYVDYYGADGIEIRFHFVNYGSERKKLQLCSESNVVLGHADYYIEGVSNWYSARSGIELSQLSNFCGVDMVISGHIHQPSDEILHTTLKDGSSIGLFYPGSPSRTAERFDDCMYMLFEYDTELKSTGYDAKLFGLKPADEVFYSKEEFIDNEDNSERQQRLERSQALTDIVKEIIDSRLTSGDIFHQIDVVPNASEKVKSIAKRYLSEAIKGA